MDKKSLKTQGKSQGYTHEIASRKELIDLLSQADKPLEFAQIAKTLDYQKHPEQLDGLSRRLNAMTRDGQLLQNRHGDFGVSTKMDLVVGTVLGHSDGFGFLVREDGEKDLFIHFKQMRQVMHGDKVLAQVSEFRGKSEAKIVEVLERANQTMVARLLVEQGAAIAIPVNSRIRHDIIIPEFKDAKNNDMVLLEITQQPSKRFGPVGKVIEVLGGHLDPGMEIEVAMYAWGIPHTWSDELLQFVGKTPNTVTQEDWQGREDIREIPLVTIDGEDSRDFDDAVWCEPTKNGWKALVAIADVSHYVQPNTILDDEAKERATSVYFPEFVVPMLPEALSNGICSLNPEVERCAMVCEMLIDKKGNISGSRFFTAVMRSHARLTYTQVGNLIDNPEDAESKALAKRLPVLNDLHNLFKVMLKQRRSRGTIDFDTVETKIKFDQDKKIEAIVPVYRNDAHKLIEELMVAANVCAGRFLTLHKIPGLYRVHEGPKPTKIQDVQDFLLEFGLKLDGGAKPTPEDYAKVMLAAKEKPEFALIQIVLLRSLSQAVYTPDNKGHFGLAHDTYAHFTSPIRRYPDLLVHRAIRYILETGSNKDYYYSAETMLSLGTHCSTNERRADDATRDVMDWLKCEYMQDKVGETFTGKVASVTSFGLFVRLDDVHVDGLLHISGLDRDYYHFDAVRHRLVGESSGKTYVIGHPMTVLVAKVDLDERKIDFALPGLDTDVPMPKRKKKQKGSGKKKDDKFNKEKKSKKRKKQPKQTKANGQPKKS